MARWQDVFHTVEHFLRAPQKIGALTPSSRFLSRRMISALDVKRVKSVVELGAGTGVITQELLSRVHTGTQVIIVESNPDAVALLQKRLPPSEKISIVCGDAGDLREILDNLKIQKVDAVVSSLPFISLGYEKSRIILSAAASSLTNEGHFIAFQYTPLMRKTLEEFFRIESSALELRNFPPAVVYSCTAKSVRGEQSNNWQKTA